MPTSVTNLTERAEKKSALGRNRQKDQPETVTRVEARTKADSSPNDTKMDIIQIFPSVFQDSIIRCPKMKAKLILKQNVEPVFRPKRPVPF